MKNPASHRHCLYVVDDDEAVRRSLMMLLFASGQPVQAFASGEAFLEALNPLQPGCVILDLRMGQGISGLEVFDRLLALRSPLVVLFLSGHGEISMAIEAVKKGAFDWVVKPNTAELLAKLPQALDAAHARAEALARWTLLTPREREVARHVALGTPNKEIARLLNPPCSPRSVESHRAHLFAKLAFANDNELGRWLQQHAWLQE
ncbi:response regulator transcription factor [Paucibacter sp. KCTC 42545]|uniref:response regulator transcription factor n=1 Tax=Paucibacter sp. KCTC 42545 TaxID=1768242 RepID=UPI000733C5A5|nr:response regulator [Paucibacter sp. KCTC 42545]ALT75907.1 LuxR family transcriptional regulator [Paucibacter sp. KCTC 42545]